MGLTIKQFRQILFWPLEIRRGNDLPIPEDLEFFLTGCWTWKAVPDLLKRGITFEDREAYAELVYFHPFVQRFLYGQPSDPSPIKLYSRPDIGGAKVRLNWWDHNQHRDVSYEIKLDVHRVHLYLFDRGVALLAVEVEAVRVYDLTLNDLKQPIDLFLELVEEFLDRFRRAYPPYWETSDLKPGHFPAKVEWLDQKGQVMSWPEPHSPEDLPDAALEHGQFSELVLKRGVPVPARHWAQILEPLSAWNCGAGNQFSYRQIEDERIPFMAYLSLDNPERLTRGDFIRLAFADGRGSSDSLPYAHGFLQDFEKNHCYDRYWDPFPSWNRRGSWMTTRYLCSGYGFVMVGKDDRTHSSPFFTDEENGALAHFRRHYFQMGLIAHFHRAALLAFSDALSQAVAERDAKRQTPEQFHETINKVLDGLLSFTHRYWFREVSNQLQARELFTLWTRNLETAALFEQVRQEAQDAKNFLDMEEQRRQTETGVKLSESGVALSRSAMRLSVVATFGLAAGLISSFLAIPWHDLAELSPSPEVFWGQFGFVAAAAVVTIGFLAVIIAASEKLGTWLERLAEFGKKIFPGKPAS